MYAIVPLETHRIDLTLALSDNAFRGYHVFAGRDCERALN